jgi:hypothetical protein
MRAECDVVSDSPHDQCLVCGSLAYLPKDRASLIAAEVLETNQREIVLSFPG